jgi:hypothetical protein
MIEILNKIKTQDIISALSIVFGVVSLIAYIEQRKSSKKNKNIIEFLNRNVDKDITIDEINELKSKKDTLESIVKEEIPNIGRVTILKDQQDFFQNQISQNYNSLLEVIKKLNYLGEKVDIEEINPDIKEYIISEISPKNTKEKKLRKVRDSIIILLALLITVGAIIPVISYYIKFGLGIVIMWEIIKYFIYDSDNTIQKEMKFKQILMFIQIVSFAIFISILLVIVINYKFNSDITDKTAFGFIGLIGIVGLIIGIFSKSILNFMKSVIK